MLSCPQKTVGIFYLTDLSKELHLNKSSTQKEVLFAKDGEIYYSVEDKRTGSKKIFKTNEKNDSHLFDLSCGRVYLEWVNDRFLVMNEKIVYSFHERQLTSRLMLPKGGVAVWWSYCHDRSGNFYLGTYGDPVSGPILLKTTDGGETWNVIFQRKRSDGYRHIHKVAIDPYTQHLWFTYGDRARGVITSPDEGKTWLDIGYPFDGFTAMAFTEEMVYFGSDYLNKEKIKDGGGASIYRYDKREKKLEKVFELGKGEGGSCYDMICYKGVLYASFVSYFKPVKAFTALSLDGLNWYQIENIKSYGGFGTFNGYSRMIGVNDQIYFDGKYTIDALTPAELAKLIAKLPKLEEKTHEKNAVTFLKKVHFDFNSFFFYRIYLPYQSFIRSKFRSPIGKIRRLLSFLWKNSSLGSYERFRSAALIASLILVTIFLVQSKNQLNPASQILFFGALAILWLRFLLFWNIIAWNLYLRLLSHRELNYRELQSLRFEAEKFKRDLRPKASQYLAIGSSQIFSLFNNPVAYENGIKHLSQSDLRAFEYILRKEHIKQHGPKNTFIYLSPLDLRFPKNTTYLIHHQPGDWFAWWQLISKIAAYKHLWPHPYRLILGLIMAQLFPEYKYYYIFLGFYKKLTNRNSSFQELTEKQPPLEKFRSYMTERMEAVTETVMALHMTSLRELILFCQKENIKVWVIEGVTHPFGEHERLLALNQEILKTIRGWKHEFSNLTLITKPELYQFQESDFEDSFHFKIEAAERFTKTLLKNLAAFSSEKQELTSHMKPKREGMIK